MNVVVKLEVLIYQTRHTTVYQKHGYRKNVCRRNPSCLKCDGNHLTIECARKDRDDIKCHVKKVPRSIMQINRTLSMNSLQPDKVRRHKEC